MLYKNNVRISCQECRQRKDCDSWRVSIRSIQQNRMANVLSEPGGARLPRRELETLAIASVATGFDWMRKTRNRDKKKKLAPHETLEAKKNDGRNQQVWEGSEQYDDSRKARQGGDHQVKNTDDNQTSFFQIPPLPGIALLQKQTKKLWRRLFILSNTRMLYLAIFSFSGAYVASPRFRK